VFFELRTAKFDHFREEFLGGSLNRGELKEHKDRRTRLFLPFFNVSVFVFFVFFAVQSIWLRLRHAKPLRLISGFHKKHKTRQRYGHIRHDGC
jgi:hypothetical protein